MAMTYLTKLKPEPMGAHSLSAAYGVNSLVMSEDGASAYISVKDVPAGTPLTNTEYWKIHTDLSAVKQSAEAAAQKANAARDEMLEIARNLTDAVEKSGNPVQAELVGGLPFDRVATALEPIQAGSGDPSPTNIRPISGRTGLNLTRCGKNLLKPNQLETQVIEGVTFTPVYTNGLLEGVVANGTASASGAIYWINYSAYFDGIFRVIGAPDVPGCTIGGNCVGSVDYNGYTHDWSGGATASFAIVVNPSATVNNAVFKPMLTGDLSATYADYEPYTGDTYTTDFGQTVYGGTLDWQTGVLTVEWGLISSYSGEVLSGKWISDRNVYSAGATPTSGAQIAYKMATPTTIQLAPREIRQLQGVNTIYGDGSISMTGRVDKALALEARIAALEAAG